MHNAVYRRMYSSDCHNLLLAELELESSQLVGLLATSIKQQPGGSTSSRYRERNKPSQEYYIQPEVH